jgi:hypothetical protein
MPRLLIKYPNKPNLIFEFSESITIGRDENCTLILPIPAVSREHARIHIIGEDEAIIEDLGSQNGILLNGEKLKSNERKEIYSRSEIQFGNFALIFLSDSQEDNFYRGRSILYLPQYDPEMIEGNKDSTFKLSAKEATSMLRDQNLKNNACIIDSSGKKIYPEANPVTFGKKGAVIKIQGWFTGGVIATISWDGKRHVITKNSGLLVSVQVNNTGITKQGLTINDKIKVGKSTFTYVLDTTT